MDKQKHSLRDLPKHLKTAFNPFYSLGAIGLIGYPIAIDGICDGDYKQIIVGVVISGIFGACGAYRDNKLEKRINE
jgi:hypothetical protein